MVDNQTDPAGPAMSGTTVFFADHPVLQKCAVIAGAGTVLIGVLGIIGLYLNITLLRSIYPGYQPMAFSAAVLSILFGTVLVSHTLRPFTGWLRVFIQLVVACIAVIEALELPLNVLGHHFIVETVMVQAGNAIAGQLTTPISPGALCIVIAVSIGFFLLLIKPTPSKERQRELDAICLAGLAVVLASFTFLLSYAYGAPFLYGTPLIPIAAPTSLALTCIGIGLAASAGPAAFPLRYFIGPSTSARLLRTFLPLTLAIVLFESFLDILLPLLSTTRNALVVSVTLVIFSIITGYVVVRVSRGLGRALEAEERKRGEAEEELARKNDNLAATNEELTATEEELRANLDELARREQKLRESEEKYRSLFENLLEGYAYCRMIYDKSGRPEDFVYLEVNRAFDEIIGTKTVTGKRVSEVFPGIKEEFPDLFEIYGKVALSGRPETFDLDFRPSGKWLHISVYSPAQEHFVAIFEDITVRRKAEKALTLYKIFTENARDIILFIRKRDGRIIEVNKAAVLTYGYTREELLGMTIFELRVSERIEYVSGQMERASEDGLVFTTLHRKKDGSDLPVEVSSVSMVVEDELVLVSIIRDISERRRAEDAQALLASIVTHSEDAIYSKTLEGIVTSWNAGAEKMYGYMPEEAIGRHVSFLAPAEYADDIESNLVNIRAGEPVKSYETIRVRKNGERFTVSLSVSPIKNANSDLIGASTIVRDITERKRAENALAMANKKLNILNNITRHDILNQITAIQGFLELYHEECRGEAKVQGYFNRLMEIVKVIDNQISFTRFYQELGVQAPDWQRVDEVAKRVAGAGGFGGIRVSTGTGPLEVFADPLFEKVFFNMYDNAARHGEHVTQVGISFESRNGNGILIVEDDGVGVPVADKEHIFRRGFGKNTGLGLFLVREILAITGMSIRETGEAGKGARFEIIVPKGMFRLGSGA
ncbi:MAG: PAS domain S-box protein [Methanoregula sp.]|uniref:PAS domain S-box protein n=1 Tax=Methanoregula sp. TaxID=2052170 RepID=UPI003D149B41